MYKLKNLFLVGLVLSSFIVSAQDEKKVEEEEKGYQFTAIKEVPCTSVKDQYRSGTCWSFSGLGFLEAEMLRMGKPAVDLSEMFIVYHAYSDKAVKYVRLHGSLNFGAGGAFHDVTNAIKKYGIVPEEIYRGLNYGEEKHVHGELDRTLLDQVKVVVNLQQFGTKHSTEFWIPIWANYLKSLISKVKIIPRRVMHKKWLGLTWTIMLKLPLIQIILFTPNLSLKFQITGRGMKFTMFR